MPALLLTPGPLTTSDQTRAALGRDWGSREADFIALSEGLRARLATLAGVERTHVAVPVQGSGTFAVEAAIGTLVPRDGRLLVLVNGAYGRRIVEIARRLGRAWVTVEAPEDQPITAERVAAALAADHAISDVALVHCETTSGLLNPLPEIAACVRQAGRRLLVDAMSSFGAVPIDGARIPFLALIGSSNKGLEGVPGLSFVIVETAHLQGCGQNSTSLSLDLFDQWRGFESNGQWRFTPPVQVVAALCAALDQLDAEGGISARSARYRQNCEVLVQGMLARGFQSFIAAGVQAPVIVTFPIPPGGWFRFQMFYDFLHARGIVIYPGKLTGVDSFRIGCIGAIGPADMMRCLTEIDGFLATHRDGSVCRPN
jgi:2-aminoethylphosphonate-pyruvate transaminase